MVWIGQFKIAKALHAAIKENKVCHMTYDSLTFPEWFELASLVLLNILDACPDSDTAAKLGIRDKVWVVFCRILRNESW